MADKLTKTEAKRLIYRELVEVLKADRNFSAALQRSLDERDSETMEQCIHEVARMLDSRKR